MTEFVAQTIDLEGSSADISKIEYTEAQADQWQNELMWSTLEKWWKESVGLLAKYRKAQATIKKLEAQNGLTKKEKKAQQWKKKFLFRRIVRAVKRRWRDLSKS